MDPKRNLPAEETNPYAPPLCNEAMLDDVEWPESGIFADGNCVVIKYGEPWPPVCLRTLEPAETECVIQLFCVGPNDKSCPSSRPRSFHPFMSVYELALPVTAPWLQKHLWASGIARLLLGIGFTLLMITLLFCVLAFLQRKFPSEAITSWVTLPVFGMSLVFLSIGSILQEVWKPLRQIEHIERGFMWISGAKREYLERFPRWPRKPGFWQKLLGV